MSVFDQRLSQLRAAAEGTRLRLLRLLGAGELTVTEASRALDQAQPSISRHLKLLGEAGLVTRHREGAWVFYGAALPPGLAELIGGLDGGVLRADDDRLASLRAEQSARAARYFAAHADEWDELRRDYLADRQAEGALRRAVTTDRADAAGVLIDLGTGTGRVLTALAGTYDRAVGYDTSAEMLAVARANLYEAGVTSAVLRRGDLFALAPQDLRADVVVLHHVLHFLPDPMRALSAAAGLLAPGGRVVVADFAAHDVETMRADHGHTRLGFSDEDLARGGRAAGLAIVATDGVDRAADAGLTPRVWRLEHADQA